MPIRFVVAALLAIVVGCVKNNPDTHSPEGERSETIIENQDVLRDRLPEGKYKGTTETGFPCTVIVRYAAAPPAITIAITSHLASVNSFTLRFQLDHKTLANDPVLTDEEKLLSVSFLSQENSQIFVHDLRVGYKDKDIDYVWIYDESQNSGHPPHLRCTLK